MRVPPTGGAGRPLRLVGLLCAALAAGLLAAAAAPQQVTTAPPLPPPVTTAAAAAAAPAARAEAVTAGPVPAPRPAQATGFCANDACHVGIVGRKVQHGPVAQRKCQACHLYADVEAHRFKLASDPAKLCLDCHTVNLRTFAHAPAKEGRCTGCHDPHGSPWKGMLVADPTRGLCQGCHKDVSSRKHVHGPVSAGACILCHEAHSSSHPKLLTQPADRLCAECHAEVVPKGDELRHVHAPVKDADCTGCHDAHASDHRFQLRDAAPKLCLSSCHKETGEAIAHAGVVHGALTQGDSCGGCHAPHFSSLPKLQKAPQPEACLGCHAEELRTADGRTLADVAALLKDNPVHHGPIRQGECTACHQPHAGENFRLLTAQYPPEFYAPFKAERYALCFKCHVPELVHKEKGTGLTRFRDGDLNLHWAHVNREKGRTCRACHEVHASKNPFHIRDAVPFGAKGWLLEIRYAQTATGGSCTPGCHDTRNYDRGEGKGERRETTAAPAVPAAAPAAAARKSDEGASHAPVVRETRSPAVPASAAR